MSESMGHPEPHPPVERDEGQCAWCYSRITDVCTYGYKIDDHCCGMGYIRLPCVDYLWLYSEKIERKHSPRKTKCMCFRDSLYAKIYMRIYRWWRKREYDRFWENVQQQDRLADDFLKEGNGNLTCEEFTALDLILEESPE